MKRIALLLLPALCLPLFGQAGARPDPVRCLGRKATIVGSPHADTLEGTNGPDVIYAGEGDDVIEGLEGADRVCAGTGDDFVAVGPGNDLVDGGLGADDIDGGTGYDYLSGSAEDDILSAGDGVTVPYSPPEPDTLIGGAGNDRLNGGDGPNKEEYFFAGDGDDVIDSGVGGSNWALPGPGDDSVTGDGPEFGTTVSYRFSSEAVTADLSLSSDQATGEGTDTFIRVTAIEGSLLDDHIGGRDLHDEIHGLDGNDIIEGLGDNDTLSGGPGDDLLDGGEGTDLATFEDSRTAVEVDLPTSVASGEGEDSILDFSSVYGSAYDDTLAGNDQDNILSGGLGNDTLLGRAGNDDLYSAEAGDAGEGDDFCLPVGALVNCENEEQISDPDSYSTILSPQHARLFSAGEEVILGGSASRGVFGPQPKRVVFALQRLWAGGCRAWDANHERLVRRSCGHFLWNDSGYDGDRWEYGIADGLPPGVYVVRSMIRQRGYIETYGGGIKTFEVR